VPAARRLDAAADFALDLGRRHREALVAALGGHAETRRLAVAKIADERIGNRLDVRPGPAGPGEVRDPEHVLQPPAHIVVGRARTEHEFDAAVERADVRDVEIGGRLPDVAHEAADEPRPVLALERDLLVVDDDGIHGCP
jgi:hypothetical protein